MLSINMRIFKTVLLLVALGSHVQCLPMDNEPSNTSAETSIANTLSSANVDHYDQRQNGTDNYRVEVDGLVVVLAPVEALLLAGATANASNLSVLDIAKPTANKPTPIGTDVGQQPFPAPKSAHSSGMHLANFILPLLRRLRHE